MEAYDLDIVNRDSVFYEIKSGNEQNLFHVEKNKGNCFKLLRFESEFLRRKFNGAFVEQKYDIWADNLEKFIIFVNLLNTTYKAVLK